MDRVGRRSCRSRRRSAVPQTLNDWVKKAEVDSGKRAGVSSEMAEKLKALERENRELARPTRSSQGAAILHGGARPPRCGLHTPRSARGHRSARLPSPHPPTPPDARADPARLSDRAQRMKRSPNPRVSTRTAGTACEGLAQLRGRVRRRPCTVARLMKEHGIQGLPGQAARTTIPDKKAPCPLDKVNRQFRVPAPNMLWVGLHHVATWKGSSMSPSSSRLCPTHRRWRVSPLACRVRSRCPRTGRP